MSPEGELGAGGEDGGEGMGDGVKGRLLEKLKEPKVMGERLTPLRTMGMGEDLLPQLLLVGLCEGEPGELEAMAAVLAVRASPTPCSTSCIKVRRVPWLRDLHVYMLIKELLGALGSGPDRKSVV